MYVVYGIVVIAAVLFAGYLGGLRAAQILEDHKQKDHKQKDHKKKGRSGPKLPNHVNCRSKLPPEYWQLTTGDIVTSKTLDKLIKEVDDEKFIVDLVKDKHDLEKRVKKLEDQTEESKNLVDKINSELDFETLSKIEEFTEQLIEEKPPICKHKYKQLILDFYGEEEYKEACIYEVLKEGKLDMEEGALCYDES